MTHQSTEKVVVVVVAFNRRELLLECLSALASQTRPPDAVLVLDNASTDGTAEAVRSGHPEVTLVELDRNTGGAGGFTAGLAEAVGPLGADLVWLMDDDTVPTETALAELLAARAHAPESARIFASAVQWIDGRDHPMNMPRSRPFAGRGSLARAEAFGCYPVRSASFVSVMIDARAVREHGLPVAAYFLWNDDFEYTARILRGSTGYVCRRSVVVHKTKVFGSTNIDPGARFKLEVRNKLWLLRLSPALSYPERLLYSAATVRRWIGTFVHSTDRATLRQGLWQGFREGLGSRPAPNTDVLAGFGSVSASVAKAETTPAGAV
jgi:rhamnopyranosyl-N-acetylglucosaminyl-diphospho-decaprenol beta-1,3/1,4-galactofuranosyltransferase